MQFFYSPSKLSTVRVVRDIRRVDVADRDDEGDNPPGFSDGLLAMAYDVYSKNLVFRLLLRSQPFR